MNHFFKHSCIAVFCVVALAAASSANARTFGEIYTDCGIGAMIAPHTDAVAAVTNVTWDLGTTAISSNISSPSTCRGGKADVASLIYGTEPNLAQNVAAGRGEHLNAVISAAGCSASDRKALISAMRRQYAGHVADAAYADASRRSKSAALYNSLYGAIDGTTAGQSCATRS